jgi:hypothetical protein
MYGCVVKKKNLAVVHKPQCDTKSDTKIVNTLDLAMGKHITFHKNMFTDAVVMPVF